ncbi:MAG: AMP-binding protein [Rhodococcus sp. (in: high G+C Gram-positive bacteria)]
MTLTYAEFAAAVDAWPHAQQHDASELTLPDALICLFAAAQQGVPVHVEDPAARPHRSEIPGDAFLLVATSGSTGMPRPLARTARSWADSFDEFTSVTRISPSDRVLVTGPLHATMHLFAAVHALWLGACVTDAAASATVTHAVPAVLRTLVGTVPNLHTAVVGGTGLDAAAAELAGNIGLVEYYGAAELSLVAIRRVPAPLRLLDGVEAEIRDGLLFVRSPYRVLGVGEWVGVGDLAALGPGGELVVRGRGEAAIDVGGTTVVAEDVERVLESIDGVRAAAVIGTPHAVLGETVTGVIELEAGTLLGATKTSARALLQKEAVPRRWAVVEKLPRTGSGKIARAQVKHSMMTDSTL